MKRAPNEMRIIVWSDLHAHMWQAAERPERWRDFVEAINAVYDIAEGAPVRTQMRKTKFHESVDSTTNTDAVADVVVFCGDLFESSKLIDARVVSAVYATLNRRIQRFSNCYGGISAFVAGNHDVIKTAPGATMLDPLQEMPVHRKELASFVVTDVGSLPLNNGAVLDFLAWGADERELQSYGKPGSILFTHCDFVGAKFGTGTVEQYGFSEDFLSDYKGRYIINGHYHVPQMFFVDSAAPKGKTAVFCVGNTIPTTWSDKVSASIYPPDKKQAASLQFTSDIPWRGPLLLTVKGSGKMTSIIGMRRIPLLQFPQFFEGCAPEGARECDFTVQGETAFEENGAEENEEVEGAPSMESLDKATLSVYVNDRYEGADAPAVLDTGVKLVGCAEEAEEELL